MSVALNALISLKIRALWAATRTRSIPENMCLPRKIRLAICITSTALYRVQLSLGITWNEPEAGIPSFLIMASHDAGRIPECMKFTFTYAYLPTSSFQQGKRKCQNGKAITCFFILLPLLSARSPSSSTCLPGSVPKAVSSFRILQVLVSFI